MSKKSELKKKNEMPPPLGDVKRKQRRPTAPPRFYRTRDLCVIFGINIRTLWGWVAQEKLPEPIRKGKQWVRWPIKQIEDLLAEIENQTTAGRRNAGRSD